MNSFWTPWYFGAAHLTRQQFLNKQNSTWSYFLNTFTGKTLVALLDGTKFDTQKYVHFDSNYNSFDPGKHRHTRGYMGICTTSGYQVDLIGGAYTNGSHGDSHYWNWITQKNQSGINNLLNYKIDLLGADRGFRFNLKRTPYYIMMPALQRKAPVHCFLINCSSIFTKIRWMIESGFGTLTQR